MIATPVTNQVESMLDLNTLYVAGLVVVVIVAAIASLVKKVRGK